MTRRRFGDPVSTDSLSVTVSGGSMGGLFTGLALEDAGHEPTIYERSTDLRGRGAGIVAQGNVRRFLEERGIADPEAITTSSSERRFLTREGDVETARSDSMVFTSWDALYRRLRDAFPDERYRMGREVVDVDPATATAAFAAGDDREADLVVAAEGGQSATRRRLFPGVGPAFADYVAWRGVVDEAELTPDVADRFDDTFVFYQGPDLLILAYFVPGDDGGIAPGERRLNWVWYDRLEDGETGESGASRDESESRTRDRSTIFTDETGTERAITVPPGRLREPVEERQLERASDVLPPVFATIVGETPAPFVQAIYDLTVPEMAVDRVCLLGDAAFVARPHTAAGTAKAAGDAVALERALERHDALDAALSTWNGSRTEYGERLVARGRRMGDERLGLADSG